MTLTTAELPLRPVEVLAVALKFQLPARTLLQATL
jgi:hypothetical protein